MDGLRNLKLIALLGTSIAVSACSSLYSEPPVAEEPSPMNFAREAQYKLSSTSHWNHVAEDMARRSLEKFIAGGSCLAGHEKCGGDYDVKVSSESTYFSDIFSKQITSVLVNEGLPVVRSGGADYTIEVDIDVVSFNRDYLNARRIDAPFRLFGPNGFLDKTGIWTVGGVNTTSVQPLKNRNTGFSWAKDTHGSAWLNNPDQIPNTEIVITLSVVGAKPGETEHYLARTTDIYYWKANNSFLAELAANNRPGSQARRSMFGGTASTLNVVGDCTSFRCESR